MNDALISTYKEECESFNLEKFYTDKVDKKAIIFISPVQKINLNIPRYMNHTNMLKEIYYLLYNEKKYYDYKDLWFNVVGKRNDIVISLTDIDVIEIVIPNKINTWQMNEFLEFKDKIENIGKNFMYVFIDSNNKEEVKDLNECSKRLAGRIDDSITSDENNLFTDKVKRL